MRKLNIDEEILEITVDWRDRERDPWRTMDRIRTIEVTPTGGLVVSHGDPGNVTTFLRDEWLYFDVDHIDRIPEEST